MGKVKSNLCRYSTHLEKNNEITFKSYIPVVLRFMVLQDRAVKTVHRVRTNDNLDATADSVDINSLHTFTDKIAKLRNT